jgi:hypothetical protein
MADEKTSGRKKGKESGEGLTQSERAILKQSMVRHDKALKILKQNSKPVFPVMRHGLVSIVRSYQARTGMLLHRA